MPIEILTVSLSEESIDRIVTALQARMQHPQVVTQSNPPSSQNPQPAAEPAFRPEADPWLNGNGAPQTYAQQQVQQYQPTPSSQVQPQYQPSPAVQQAPPQRFCPHGEMRFVQAGVNSQGKSYNAFYGCKLQRGDPNQCKPVRV